jgi:excisionase family DNA binding protein
VTVAEGVERILLTREEAARACGVSLNKIDEWSKEPGFPIIREGTHFVRIPARAFEDWLEVRAEEATRRKRYRSSYRRVGKSE